MKKTLLIAAVLLTSFRSGPERVPLVELYTSEGCSSTPPANAWLSGLRDDPKLWTNFVPVGFHVDYWDYLGWKDPWASAENTGRQRELAASWKDGSVYTPGVVLDGREWRGWRGSRGVPRVREKAGMLEADVGKDGRVAVRFAPYGKGDGAYRVNAALLGFDLDSRVRSGENAGRTLTHDFSAVERASVPLKKTRGVYEGSLSLSGVGSPDRGLALWVSREGEPAPVQALGGYLPVSR